jgi:hypothetical protein
MANNYEGVNYEDQRLTDVEADKNATLNDFNAVYSDAINKSDGFYDKMIDATEDYKNEQTKIQNEQTQHTLNQIQQQKDKAEKDYTKEQSGAYVDWQKQSNKYGANAEAMAANGMQDTGFSESSQVSMYTTYQNRVATARETYNMAVMNYDNAMKDARLQNSAALAEIAANAFQKQLELSLQGFQYKNQLILDQANKELEIKQIYHQQYQDVLAQINHEDSMKEQIRQYNQNYQLQVKEYEEGIRQFNEEIARLKAKDAQEHALEIEKLELQKKALAQEKEQADREYKLKLDQLNEQKKATVVKSNYGNSANINSKNAQQKLTQTHQNIAKENQQPTIDYASLNKAGYTRMLSEAEMARLVASGALTYKIVGNKIVFEKGTNPAKATAKPQNIVDKFYAFR